MINLRFFFSKIVQNKKAPYERTYNYSSIFYMENEITKNHDEMVFIVQHLNSKSRFHFGSFH